MTTAQEIKQMLNAQAEQVAAHLLPGGKRQGRSWCAGSVRGEPGQSLRVCLDGSMVGTWSDFASNDNSGDLIDLWQQSRGITFVQAIKEIKGYLGVQDVTELKTARKRRSIAVPKPKYSKPSNTVLEWFEGRGIQSSTLEAFKVGQRGNIIVFPFFSPSGELELTKFRDLDAERKNAKKKIWSNQNPDYHLWGWHALDDNTRTVVICEGEIDALSWYQQSIPALSVPQGGGDGNKQTVWLENDFDRLLRFETIFVSMDMDVTGQSAIKPIITRLGIERCKIIDLGKFKDANEAHANGIVLNDFLKNAKAQDPEELKRLADHHEEILDEFKNSEITGVKLPWDKTFNQIRLRPSEISVWAGINSHGKSIALSHVAIDAVFQGERVCIASMEMKPRKLGRKMYQQIIGNNTPDNVDFKHATEFLGDHVWLFECYGTAKANRIIEVFTYAHKRYGVSQFFIDSLAKCGLGEDDYNGQKDFVDRLMEFAGEFNVHVHLVVHIRKKEDESKVPGKMDIKGTGAITDMVDNVFVWWRNKGKELAAQNGQEKPHEPDAKLNCVKQRETGEEPMFGLFFHKDSCQFTGGPEASPRKYLSSNVATF